MTRAASSESTGGPAQTLQAALDSAGGDPAKALELLRHAGLTLRKGRERDPAFAAHVPNTADLSANFSYSADGTSGHETCCGGRPRGLYQGDRLAARLPFIWGVATAKNGRTMITAPLMSADAKGAHRAVIAWEEIRDGSWGGALNIGLTPDRQIVTAAAAAIIELAYEPGVPQFAAAVTPAARTPDGRIPAPVPETMPSGYWDQPTGDEATRLRARAAQLEIAARNPLIALTWGAAVGAAYAGPLKLRQSGIWELTGPPRSGKTTTLMLAASVWGCPEFPPDGMLFSWDQTAKGTGRHLGELGIFPAFMDETGTADFGPDEWAKLTYSLSLGASRKTAKTRGSMGTNQTPGWQGFLFTTGNGSVTEGATAGKFAGVAARVVTVSGQFTADPDECRELDRAALEDYGELGPRVIETLSVDQMGALYADVRDALDVPSGGIAGTLAGKIVLAIAGAHAIDLVRGTGTMISDAAYLGALQVLAGLPDAETDRERILRWLAESMSANRAEWADQIGYDAWGADRDRQSRRLAGLYDDTWVYVYPSTWTELGAATGVGTSAKLALSDMHDRGELYVPDRRRRSGSWQAEAPRWANRSTVYKITRAAVDSAVDGSSGGGVDSAVDGSSGGGVDSAAPSLTSAVDSSSAHAGGRQEPLPDTGAIDSAAPALTSAVDSVDSVDSPAIPDQTRRTGVDSVDSGPTGGVDSAAPALTRDVDAVDSVDSDLTPSRGNVALLPEVIRATWLAATWNRSDNRNLFFRSDEQRSSLARIVALLDANPDAEDKEAVRALANSLHVLAELEGTGKVFGGPFIPELHNEPARLKPWKKDGLPVCVEMARIIEGYPFERTGYRGPVAVFDRNGAWVGAAGTAYVAHGALTHTGPCEPAPSRTAPGYYLATVYPWTEPGMPSPLGNADPGSQIWIPAPTMGLLAELARAGRWPDETASDSWTGEPITLKAWGRLVREIRRYSLERYGYGSGAYQAVKDAFSMSMSMMNGELAADSAQPRRVWKKCKTERIDWRHQTITNSAVMMWRTMDRCLALARENSDFAPIGMRNKDELIIPDNGAAELVTTTNYYGGNRPPVRVDDTGVSLGAFKVKSREDWS